MERSNRPPKPECCLQPGQEPESPGMTAPNDLREAYTGQKRGPQAGFASCLSNSASKCLAADGDGLGVPEPNTDTAVASEALEDLPGSKSVARAAEVKQRALDHRGHPRFPARRVIIFRTPSASWAVQAVTGPSKPFSTSHCSHSMRRCRSSCASSSRRPSRTTSVADPYAPLFTFSATKCLCRAVNATFITEVSLA